MKKFFFLLFLTGILVSCNKPESIEEDANVLKDALLAMDISSPASGKKSIGIVGDSNSVHILSRYMCYINSFVKEYGFGDFISSYNLELPFTDNPHPQFYGRDTINHTFTFQNDAVVNWESAHPIEETVHIGYIACSENIVFCAIYDTNSKKYFDPLSIPYGSQSEGIVEYGGWPRPDDGRGYVYDTLGYIPNSQMRANRAQLEQLLKDRQYKKMIEFFKSNYHIYTCTGEEYRELERLGLN